MLILFVLLFSLHESEDGRARFSVALVGFVIVEKAVSRMKFGKIHETKETLETRNSLHSTISWHCL